MIALVGMKEELKVVRGRTKLISAKLSLVATQMMISHIRMVLLFCPCRDKEDICNNTSLISFIFLRGRVHCDLHRSGDGLHNTRHWILLLQEPEAQHQGGGSQGVLGQGVHQALVFSTNHDSNRCAPASASSAAVSMHLKSASRTRLHTDVKPDW